MKASHLAQLSLIHIGDQVIEATGNHPFWVAGKGWLLAEELQVGDLLVQSDGDTLEIDEIIFEPRHEVVYNFEVADFHTYFVSDLGIWVHNEQLKECGLGGTGNTVVNGNKYWNRTTEFRDVKVYQRNDIIDPNKTDAMGRTNLQRMKQGLAPIGPDGKSVNLHHMTQRNESSIAEVTQTFHQDNSKVLHINPNTVPSGINRNEFNKWKSEYWKNRANDFK